MTGTRRMPAGERFFLWQAIAMAAVIVAGFAFQLAMGRSTFRSPPILHLHAFVFFGWTVLYVVQSALAVTGRRLHRTLGWIGASWAVAILLLGSAMTVIMLRHGTVPFFFAPAVLMLLDWLSVLAFAGLFAWAIVVRRRTEWHRRLMVCAMASLTSPAIGRLLPMPLFVPWSAEAIAPFVLLFPVAGMIADWRNRGRVHPAWWWGAGVIAVSYALIQPIARSSFGAAVYARVTAGAPAALPAYVNTRVP